MKEISERIKMVRKCTRLSREEFCSKVNVSAATLEKWESDSLSPSVEDILKISKTYGISTDFLLNGTPTKSDTIFLDRKLSKTDLVDEIKEFVLSKLECTSSKKMLDKLYWILQLIDGIFAKDINLEGMIYFDINDLLEIGDYDVYLDVAKHFQVNGDIKFEMLDPNKHSIGFYEEALKNDADNLEVTFLNYTDSKELWNDKVLLWMINRGATCVELVDIEGHDHQTWSIDGCENDNTTYEPVYSENFVLTFLLKAELERRINKKHNI